MVAYGWQGNRFRFMVCEVKGTRKRRVLSLLDRTVDNTMQMSIDWLEGYASAIAERIVESAAGALGKAVAGPIEEFVGQALDRGQLDLYLLRARDLRNNSWETRGYRLISVGRDSVSTVDGRNGRGSIDAIEQVQVHNYPSIR